MASRFSFGQGAKQVSAVHVAGIASVALLVASTLAGCASSVPREFKRSIEIVPPAIEETLPARVEGDSLISGEKFRGSDTVIVVRYIPRERKIYVRAKPDTVHITVTDTLEVTRTETKGSIWNTLLKGFAGGILAAAVLLALAGLRR